LGFGTTMETPEIRDKKIYYKWSFFSNVLRVLDATCVVFSGMAALMAVSQRPLISSTTVMMLYFSAFIFIVTAQHFRCYHKRNMKTIDDQAVSTISAGLSTVVVVLGGALLSRGAAEIDLPWVLAWLGIAIPVVAANRIAVAKTIHHLQVQGHLRENVAVVGASDLASKIVSHFTKSTVEVNLVGRFADKDRVNPALRSDGRVYGSIDDLVSLARNDRIDRIILALPGTDEEHVPALLNRLRNAPARVELCLSANIWSFGSDDSNRLCGIPLVTLANGRIDSDITLMKNIEDRVFSLLLLILLSPLLLLIALVIKLDSPGSALFRQPRYGLNNREFNVYKFRTMRRDAPVSAEVRQATRDDPRVTRIGRFLRRSSLDELPQLLNVVKGEMSLIGPRPHAVPHNIKYEALIDEYPARHNLKPGITGWAQVNGLRGETDTDDKMKRRVEYDLYYIENWSFILDVKIIWMTIFKVWTQETAY
jgi:Undecaprenyl-phosphate glucose phosphotransferase